MRPGSEGGWGDRLPFSFSARGWCSFDTDLVVLLICMRRSDMRLFYSFFFVWRHGVLPRISRMSPNLRISLRVSGLN